MYAYSMRVCTYIYIHTHIYIHICVCVCTYVCMYVSLEWLHSIIKMQFLFAAENIIHSYEWCDSYVFCSCVCIFKCHAMKDC